MVTGVSQLLFPHQANGSLTLKNGQVTGSELIGQSFTSDRYFHPRPSAAGSGYDATASGGSNLSQSNAKLVQRIQTDIDKLQSSNAGNPVPIDMVTTSGSGLDPDITPDNAYFQAGRIATARGMSEDAVRKLIAGQIRNRDLRLLGESRVNVVKLNLARHHQALQNDGNRCFLLLTAKAEARAIATSRETAETWRIPLTGNRSTTTEPCPARNAGSIQTSNLQI